MDETQPSCRYMVNDYMKWRLEKHGIDWDTTPPLEFDPTKKSTKIQRQLRSLTEEMEEKYGASLQDMCGQLLVPVTSDTDSDNAHDLFNTIADELFQDGENNWGRCIALFAFAGNLAEKCVEKQLPHLVNSIVGWTCVRLTGHFDEFVKAFVSLAEEVMHQARALRLELQLLVLLMGQVLIATSFMAYLLNRYKVIRLVLWCSGDVEQNPGPTFTLFLLHWLREVVPKLSRLLVTNGRRNIWNVSNKPSDWPLRLEWKDPNNKPKDDPATLKAKLAYLIGKCRVKNVVPEELKSDINLIENHLQGNAFNESEFIESVHRRQKCEKMSLLVAAMKGASYDVVFQFAPQLMSCIAGHVQGSISKTTPEVRHNIIDQAMELAEVSIATDTDNTSQMSVPTTSSGNQQACPDVTLPSSADGIDTTSATFDPDTFMAAVDDI